MSKPFFSEREVRLARSFIKAIKGNEQNGYLLLAVIAWQRAMTKSHDAFWKALTKYSAFRAGQLLAGKLSKLSGLDSTGYATIIKTLRLHGTSADVARSFIVALEQSKWDKHHFGYIAPKDGYWETKRLPFPPYSTTVWVPSVVEEDPLLLSWTKLTGHNIPKGYFIDRTYTPTPKPPPPPPPRQPRSLIHVLPQPDYLSPYGSRVFYEQRKHHGENVLPE